MDIVRNMETGSRDAAAGGQSGAEPVNPAQLRSVSEEVAQLRATISALQQQLEKMGPAGQQSTPGQNPAGPSGMKRLQSVALFLFKKLYYLVTAVFGTIMGILSRIVILAVVLAIIYELLVVVPMVGYPGAVKEELGLQATAVKQFVVNGWQAAKAVTAQPSAKDNEAAAEPDKRNPKPAGK